MNIKLLTFDLDHTLWAPETALARAEVKMYGWLQQNHPQVTQLYSPERFLKYRLQIAARQPQLAVQVSTMRVEVLRLIAIESGMDAEQAASVAKQAFAVFYYERSQQLDFYPDALATVEQLAQRYELIALTNGNADLKLIGVDHLFKAYFNADIVGTAKPSPEMFNAALTTAQVNAEQCVHIGDCPHNDVLAAKEVGMKAIWVNASQLAWPTAAHSPDAIVQHVREIPAILERWSS